MHAYLKKDWILISCSGTLGNVIYTNELFTKWNSEYSKEFQKWEVKSVSLCIFASKYGYTLLTRIRISAV